MTQAQRVARQRLYATDAQLCYLRRLLDEAFGNRYTHGLCLDRHHLDRVTKSEASSAIDQLLSAKRNDWRRTA